MKKKIARRWLRKMNWKILKCNIGLERMSPSDNKYYKKCVRVLLHYE